MRIVDFAKMLTESINDKINQSRGEMHESHNPIYNQSLLIEIRMNYSIVAMALLIVAAGAALISFTSLLTKVKERLLLIHTK